MAHKKDILLQLFKQGVGVKEAAKQANCTKRHAEIEYDKYMKSKTAGTTAKKPEGKKEGSLNSENAKSSENTSEPEPPSLDDLKYEAEQELSALGTADSSSGAAPPPEPVQTILPPLQEPYIPPSEMPGMEMNAQDLEAYREDMQEIILGGQEMGLAYFECPMTKLETEKLRSRLRRITTRLIKNMDYEMIVMFGGLLTVEVAIIGPRWPLIMKKLAAMQNPPEKPKTEKAEEKPKEPPPAPENPLLNRKCHTKG